MRAATMAGPVAARNPARISVLIAFASGLVFGTGLLLGGLTDPAGIRDFLDLAGAWRPQPLATLGAAVVVAAGLFALARRRGMPLAAERFHWPTRRDLDARLLFGSVLFGAGWALAGYCPGPALTALGGLSTDALVFIAAMVAGTWLARRLG